MSACLILLTIILSFELAHTLLRGKSCRHVCEYLQYHQFQSRFDQDTDDPSIHTYEHEDASFTSKADIGSDKYSLLGKLEAYDFSGSLN